MKNEQCRPAEELSGTNVQVTDLHQSLQGTASLEVLRVSLGAHGRRLVEEALLSALPASWERRAAEFEAARPRPSDFNGLASAGDLAARDRRCAEAAQACRDRAALLGRHGDILGVEVGTAVSSVFEEVAA